MKKVLLTLVILAGVAVMVKLYRDSKRFWV